MVRMQTDAYLEPGKYYNIFIQEQISELLERPYEPYCFDYSGNLKKFKNNATLHAFFDAPLSENDCLIACLGSC